MHTLIRGLLCSAALFLTASGIEDKIYVDARLKNGSVIKGSAPGIKEIQFKTRYATMTIPVKELRSITWGNAEKEERDTVNTADGTYQGWVQKMEPLSVDTGYGTLTLPIKDIRQLRVSVGDKGNKIEDGFDGDALDNRWTVTGGTWKVTGGELQATSRSSAYNNQLHFDQELESYTLEVDLKGNNFGVLWHVQNATDATALWLTGGTVYVFSGSNWWNMNVGTMAATVQTGSYSKLKLEISGSSATITLDGNNLGTVTSTYSKGKVGLWVYSGTVKFDNFKITQ